jgi:hypothetical protein
VCKVHITEYRERETKSFPERKGEGEYCFRTKYNPSGFDYSPIAIENNAVGKKRQHTKKSRDLDLDPQESEISARLSLRAPK